MNNNANKYHMHLKQMPPMKPILLGKTFIVIRQWNTKYCVMKHQTPSKERKVQRLKLREKGIGFFSFSLPSLGSIKLCCLVSIIMVVSKGNNTTKALIYIASFYRVKNFTANGFHSVLAACSTHFPSAMSIYLSSFRPYMFSLPILLSNTHLSWFDFYFDFSFTPSSFSIPWYSAFNASIYMNPAPSSLDQFWTLSNDVTKRIFSNILLFEFRVHQLCVYEDYTQMCSQSHGLILIFELKAARIGDGALFDINWKHFSHLTSVSMDSIWLLFMCSLFIFNDSYYYCYLAVYSFFFFIWIPEICSIKPVSGMLMLKLSSNAC